MSLDASPVSNDRSNFQVVKAAQGRIPVFLDGGVRRGTDVFKALALGASGIFVSSTLYAPRPLISVPCHKKPYTKEVGKLLF